MRLSWTPDSANYYNTIPDVPVKQQPWIDASNGVIPSPPIAVVRSKSSSSVTGFLLFKNGLIGATGTGNDGYVGCCSNPIPYPFKTTGRKGANGWGSDALARIPSGYSVGCQEDEGTNRRDCEQGRACHFK
jgi:hypothetical protein